MKISAALSCLLSIGTSGWVSAADGEPTTISFPIPDRPEGITNGPDSTLLVGQISSGKVLSIDALTGETKEVVGEQQPLGTRQAWGLWYYNGAIFVGGGGPPFGGGTPQIYVYSATDGSPLATCDPLSINTDVNMTFMNDVTVVGNIVYATDSFNNKLMSFDADEAINNGNCVVSEVDLPEAFKAKNDEEWGANGLVEYADGLLVVHETGGFVYHIGNIDGDSPTFQEVIPADSVATGDGLNVLDDKLYITMNYRNTIAVFQLDQTGGTISATPLTSITSAHYYTPATSALYCGYIYSANSLFATHEISDPANDTVVGVKNMYDECVVDSETPVAAPENELATTLFPIPDRPKGITNGPDSTLLVGQILSGKVLSIDVITGETKEVVGEQQPSGTRQAWGLWYYNGAIFVGGGGPPFGGGTPQIYVYNATDGSQLATCDPVSTNTDVNMTFMNDVTVVGNIVYATDSFNNKLMSFDADEAINNGNCVVSEVDLPEVFKAKTDADWGANGLVEYADGLLVVHETGGFVYHIGNLDGDSPTFQEVIPAGGAVAGDGLNVLGDKLYITKNFENRIAVFELREADGNTIAGTDIASITSPDHKTPATSALYCGYIYSANSLFGTHDIPDPADDTVVGVKNMYDECVVESVVTTKPPEATPTPPDTTDPTTVSFPIPDRPEGITNGPDSTLLVGQISSGKVLSINALTGETKDVVGEQQPLGTRHAWGLWYYNGAIFVGGGGPPFGGGTPQVYVYSATDGSPLATCDPLSTNTDANTTFMNDVTVVGGTAYATDSFNNKLMVFDADEAINNGNCVVSEVDLPEVFKAKTDADWGANGLVEYAGGLLVVHETGGFVYHIGNLDGDSPTFQEVIPAGAATGDGLNVLEDKLYITMNYANKIGVFQLRYASGTISATPLASITSPAYKTPATSALYCGYIYSANSLFATHEISDPANDTVVGVKNMYDECVVDSDATKPPTAAPPSPGFVAKSSLGVVSATAVMVCVLLF